MLKQSFCPLNVCFNAYIHMLWLHCIVLVLHCFRPLCIA